MFIKQFRESLNNQSLIRLNSLSISMGISLNLTFIIYLHYNLSFIFRPLPPISFNVWRVSEVPSLVIPLNNFTVINLAKAFGRSVEGTKPDTRLLSECVSTEQSKGLQESEPRSCFPLYHLNPIMRFYLFYKPFHLS